jgi:anaerobic ribonucleoside-triphosphate reductase
MLIDFSYGKEFDDLFEDLKKHEHYRALATLDGIGAQTDMVQFSKKFFGQKSVTADVSVDSNANVEDSSIIAYEAEVPKPLFRINAYYLLWKYAKKFYGKDIAKRLVDEQFFKEYYINDFHKFAVCPYCFNFSCLDVVFNGLPFVKKIKSMPPKHLDSFVNQMIQFVTYASNSVAGAVGLADFLICLSYYYDKEQIYPDELVKQHLQSFIFSVNQPFRGGHQSAFTNVSLFDDNFLAKLCAEYSFPDGSKPNIGTVKHLQELYMDVMNETLSHTPCTFPVTTACFAVDDDREIIDKVFLKLVCRKNLQFGWINFYAGNTSTLSSCCRLRSDNAHHYFNTFGSGGTKIGSLSVTTLNLPRLAYEAKEAISEDKAKATALFIVHLQKMVEDAARVNNIKRHIVQLRIKNGNLPLYTLGFMDIRKQYSTCGLNGINEAVEILGYDILTEEGQHLVDTILNTVNTINDSMEKKFGFPHNCEQTPSENSAVKLATADKILGYNDKYDLYSNQFIPLTTKADLLDRIMLQGRFDHLMTGGAILHVNVAEQIEKVSDMSALIEASVKQGVIYQAINYVLNVCENGHMTVGMGDTCSICGGKITDKLTRVVGFLTNTKNWSKVRRTEDFPNRKFYEVG